MAINMEAISGTPFYQAAFKAISKLMESRLRYRFWGPQTILQQAALRPGQTVLEIGCGTGFFSIPAAGQLGEGGKLYALDISPDALEEVTRRQRKAGLANIFPVRASALACGLPDGCIDTVLLFGVIPSPTLPLSNLLAELQRVLRPGGSLALWTAFPWELPKAITSTGSFSMVSKGKNVFLFRKTGGQ